MLRTVFNPELSGKRILFLIIIAVMIFSISCSNDSTEPEEENLKLIFSPSEQTVTVNTETDYIIKVENAENLFAFSAEIVFDSSIAELVSNAVVVGGFWNSDLVELNVVEEDRLSITISLQQTSGEDGIDGDGELFTFSIEGSAVGQTNLTFENLQMIDENGNEISNFNEIEITNGRLIVE
ncbi:MAG: hypothetical protein KAS53_03115 [Candidatus Cloacimonetes bacterium]|nr:hypothetical protein [Candidatus Cloacimonadota bacterium]